MEVLLVLAILVILGSLVVISIGRTKAGADEDAARIQIGAFKIPLNSYRLHVGSYPTTTQGLQALCEPPADLRNPAKWRGPYLDDEKLPLDPWDNPYQYELLNAEVYRISSWGADGVSGTADDVSNR
jgi:general secretion pathway protein G